MGQEIVKFEAAIGNRRKEIKSLLPATMDAARFCRMAVGFIERSDKLASCSTRSFVLSVMSIAELGLEPSLGQVYIIPYSGTATLQIGYQGMIQLAMNSGFVLSIWADVIREGDVHVESHGTSRSLTHEKTGPKDGRITHAYAVAILKGTGERAFIVLDRDDIEKRKAVSKTADRDDSPWNQWPVEMCKKTAVRALYKMLPKSTQMAAAAVLDDDGTQGREARPVMVESTSEPLPWEQPAADPDACPAENPFDGEEDKG